MDNGKTKTIELYGEPRRLPPAGWQRVIESLDGDQKAKLEKVREAGLEAELYGDKLVLRMPELDEYGQVIEPSADNQIARKVREAFEVVAEDPAYELVEDENALKKICQRLSENDVIAIDTETTGLDPLTDKIRILQLAAPGQIPVVIDLFKIPADKLHPLKNLLQGPALKIAHNWKFDWKFLYKVDLPVTIRLFDTMLAEQLLEAGLPKQKGQFTLERLARTYLKESLPKEEQTSDWSGKLTESQLKYAARDAEILLRLQPILARKLNEAGLVETAKLEFALVPAMAQMELNGMSLDMAAFELLKKDLIDNKEKAANGLKEHFNGLNEKQMTLFGESHVNLNLNSHVQLLKALQDLGIPVKNTNNETLLPLAGRYPVIKSLINYRKAEKRVSAFGDALPRHVHPFTKRIHPDYWQLGAATGRMSCNKPNLQQVPRTTDFRRCFVPAPGYKMVVADYSQIELRVAAEISGDKTMIEAYRQGKDLHALTASLVTGKHIEEITKNERQQAKPVNFGLTFGMGAVGLQNYARNSYGVNMNREQAELFKRKFFNAYREIAGWHREVRKKAGREARTLGGRRRRWPKGDEPRLTALLNTPVQGTAGDILKKALSMLPEALDGTGARIIGAVHDEIILEAPEDRAGDVARILEETMKKAGGHFLKKVPVEVEVSIGDSWAEK